MRYQHLWLISLLSAMLNVFLMLVLRPKPRNSRGVFYGVNSAIATFHLVRSVRLFKNRNA